MASQGFEARRKFAHTVVIIGRAVNLTPAGRRVSEQIGYDSGWTNLPTKKAQVGAVGGIKNDGHETDSVPWPHMNVRRYERYFATLRLFFTSFTPSVAFAIAAARALPASDFTTPFRLTAPLLTSMSMSLSSSASSVMYCE